MKKNDKHEHNETEYTETEGTETEYTETEGTEAEGTEYYTENDEQMTEEENDDEEDEDKKKKSSKKFTAIVAAVFIVGGLGLGYNIFLKPHNIQRPNPVRPMGINTDANKGVANSTSPSTSPSNTVANHNNDNGSVSIPPDTSSNIPSNALAPKNTPNALPDLGGNVKPPVEQQQIPAAPVTQQSVPAQPAQVAPDHQPSSSPSNLADGEVHPSQPDNNPFATPAQSPAPVPAQSQAPQQDNSKLQSSIDTLIDRMDSFEDTMNKVSDSVNSEKQVNTVQDQKISDLESRVSKLESEVNGLKTQPVKPVVVKETPKTTHAVKKYVAPRHHRERREIRNHHRVEESVVLISDNSDSVVRSPRVSHREVRHVSTHAGAGYQLQAIVSGKAWVKRPNGTTAVYGVGDILPNGYKIGKIDANNGVFDSTGRLWISQ